MRVRVSMLFGVLREWENKAILSVFHLLSSRGKFWPERGFNELLPKNTIKMAASTPSSSSEQYH
jgi:hypothetical protein